MALKFEHYNPEVHNSHLTATLIYLADQEFNAMIYGNRAEGVEAIKNMMQMEVIGRLAPIAFVFSLAALAQITALKKGLAEEKKNWARSNKIAKYNSPNCKNFWQIKHPGRVVLKVLILLKFRIVEG